MECGLGAATGLRSTVGHNDVRLISADWNITMALRSTVGHNDVRQASASAELASKSSYEFARNP